MKKCSVLVEIELSICMKASIIIVYFVQFMGKCLPSEYPPIPLVVALPKEEKPSSELSDIYQQKKGSKLNYCQFLNFFLNHLLKLVRGPQMEQ